MVATAEEVANLVASGAEHVGNLVDLALVHANKHAVREGGGIASIVALLPLAASSEPLVGARRTSTVVSALWSLCANSSANQDAIRHSGGIARLVAQLARPGRAEVPDLAAYTAGALWCLVSNNTANQHAVREAGGIAALIAVLAAATVADEPQPEAAYHAVRAC